MRIKYLGNHTPKSEKLYKYIENNHPEYLTEENPDLIIVAGGDGSILHAIQDYSDLNIPFFGIGLGTLNFLMNEISKPKKLMRTILEKRLDIVDARSMSVRVIRNGKSVFSGLATNDIMLGKGIMDYHKFIVNSDDSTFNDKFIEGQSLIVSTAIGSSAISLNNNVASIPSLDMDLFALSSVLASRETTTKKFIASNQKIEIKINSERHECQLFVDGNATVFDLERGDKVIVKRGKKIQFAFLNYKEFEIKRLS